MNITNNSAKPITMPCHTVLKPGVATPVPKWSDYSANAIIQAWVGARILTVEVPPVKRKGGKSKKEYLQAELGAVNQQVEEARKYGDFVGGPQLENRAAEIQSEIDALSDAE